jgi:hypothetical protein
MTEADWGAYPLRRSRSGSLFDSVGSSGGGDGGHAPLGPGHLARGESGLSDCGENGGRPSLAWPLDDDHTLALDAQLPTPSSDSRRHRAAVAAARAAVAVAPVAGSEAARGAAAEAAAMHGVGEAATAAAEGAVAAVERGAGAAAAAYAASIDMVATEAGYGRKVMEAQVQSVVDAFPKAEAAWEEEGGTSLDELVQMQEVLERWKFSGINRSVQVKPKKWKDGKASVLQLVLKWGGELTDAGKKEAQQFGVAFRQLFYGESGGSELLRLHATFRHDLKIYTSDEGRVQLTAAAFSKGMLELEGDSLTPILVTLVNKDNEMLDHSGHASAQAVRDSGKQRLDAARVEGGGGGGGEGGGAERGPSSPKIS